MRFLVTAMLFLNRSLGSWVRSHSIPATLISATCFSTGSCLALGQEESSSPFATNLSLSSPVSGLTEGASETGATNSIPANPILGSLWGTSAITTLPNAVSGTALYPSQDATSKGPTGIQWGRVRLHSGLGVTETYATGLIANPRSADTWVNTVLPTVRLEVHEDWILAYQPQIVTYSNDLFHDGVNQSLDFQGHLSISDFDTRLQNQFARSDNSLVETGGQTQQTVNETRLMANHSIGSHSSIEFGAIQNLRWAEGFNDVYSWSVPVELRWWSTPAWIGGVHFNAGYDQVDPGVDMTSQRIMALLEYHVGSDFQANVSPGIEIREFLVAGSDSHISPALTASIVRRIHSGTTLALISDIQVTPSYYADQFTQTSSLMTELRQNLLFKTTLSVSGGYRWSKNNSTTEPDTTVNRWGYSVLQVQLSRPFLRHGSLGLVYSRSRNQASGLDTSYLSNQAGVQASYGF